MGSLLDAHGGCTVDGARAGAGGIPHASFKMPRPLEMSRLNVNSRAARS